MHTQIPITGAEEHTHTQLKVEEGVHISIVVRRITEDDEEQSWIEAEEEARLVEEARLKSEEEDQAQLRADE